MTKAERDKLIVENLGFVRHLAHKYKMHEDVDDLIQEGTLGLIRATELFDPSKNIKFITYASYWIKSYMGRYLNKSTKHGVDIESVEDSPVLHSASAEDIEEHVINRDLSEKLYKAIKSNKARQTKEKELDILQSRYLQEHPTTLAELGRKYKVSRESIRQIEAKLLKQIERKLNNWNSEHKIK